MWVHFWHHHVRENVGILEESNLSHPRCLLCDMLVSLRYLSGMHGRTAQCKKGAEQKQQRLAAEEERAFTSRAVSAYGCPLDMVTSYKYLGRVI